jgi:hypothetical protein
VALTPNQTQISGDPARTQNYLSPKPLFATTCKPSCSEAKIYQRKREIHGFFVDFIGSLPADGIDHFSLRSRHVDRNIAYITWSVGSDIPLGTDTFVVDNGKIIRKTFAMYAVPAQ